jgi:drug/metabolite transporter (DMT)-like permease
MPYLLITSLLWAFSFGLIKRHLGNVDSSFVTVARLALALLVFLPFLRLRGVGPGLGVRLLGVGAIQFGLVYLLYLESFRYLRAYEAALFTITTPIFVTLLADAFERTLRPRAFAAALLAVAGTAFVAVKSVDFSVTLTGLLLVQASNAAFALGQILYRRLRAHHADVRDRDVFALLYLGACVPALAALLGKDNLSVTLTAPQIWTLLYLGVLASGVGFFLWNVGATRVTAGLLAVMNNLKVPLAVVVSIVAFGERAPLLPLLASLATLGGAVWLARPPR